jgi:hypothetical protein
MDAWVGKDTSHKPIIKFNYSKLHIGALALCAPQPPASGAVIYARTFDVDLDLFVVISIVSNRYRITNIVDVIKKNMKPSKKLYKPYKLRNVTDKWRDIVHSQIFSSI